MEKIIFEKNIIILGFGSIAKAVLPLVTEHFDVTKQQIKVLTQDFSLENLKNDINAELIEVTLNAENYAEILDRYTNQGDLVVNLTAGVNSIDLMRYCSNNQVLYLDTCIEIWEEDMTPDSTTYDDREQLLNLKEELKNSETTALSSMGANPGIVSLLSKRLLIIMAKELQIPVPMLGNTIDWAALAQTLTVHTIHINEKDSQHSDTILTEHDFASTWSVEAMIIECIEPAEMSIGSHEVLPPNAQYSGEKNKRDIFFKASGMDVRIKTWLPMTGEQTGMILNHNEPMSLAELYSTETYSPTTCFVYQPSALTLESLKHLNTDNYLNKRSALLLYDITQGVDELGTFIMTKKHGSYWLGSQLSIETARKINPDSSATSLQVAGGVIAGMCWVATHQDAGVLEPEDIVEHDYILDISEKYWGGYIFSKSSWQPTKDKPAHEITFEDFVA